MTNETMRQKLVDTAKLLKDLTMAVVAIAEEFGEVTGGTSMAPLRSLLLSRSGRIQSS